jgi:DNA-3-methyladenine glycosylase II
MTNCARYDQSVAFLRDLDDDWASLVALVGRCSRDPKAAHEPYEALIRAVSYQQLTASAGDGILATLKALFPDSAFPTPENIISAEFEALRGCGFSARKIATIRTIAEGAVSGIVPPHELAAKMDDEELISRIITIKGIGRWTVEMLLMYSLERMDILPVDDFGIREGYRALKSLPRQPSPKEMREIGTAWALHRTVASWYLWRIPRDRGNSIR